MLTPTTTFAIKTNLAAYILFILLLFIILMVATAIGGGDFLRLMENKYFSGTVTIVLLFIAFFVAAKTLLKNTQLSAADAQSALQKTWYGFILIEGGLLLLNFQESVEKFGLVYQIIFLILRIGCIYGALFAANHFFKNTKTAEIE